jgi:hypothetical protein
MAWVVALGALGAGLWVMDKVDSHMYIRGLEQESGLKPVRSTVDQRIYRVRNGVAAADLLARARQIAWSVVQELQRRPPPANPLLRPGVQRLRSVVPNIDAISVMELGPTPDNLIAFNWKKGDEIALCLTDGSGQDGKLTGVETVTFVLLHELAHSMTAGYDPLKDGRTQHSDEFYAYENLMYQTAADMGLLRPASQNGAGVCGTAIRHPKAGSLPA